MYSELTTKKYSIIVPAYNAEDYLSECIESIMTQITEEDEVIIVNDGSDDNTAAIADSYSKKYENIRVLHQENKGNAGAKNSGLKMALGKWIMFVDADDMLEPDCFSKINEAVDAMSEDDVLIFNFSYLFPDGRKEGETGFENIEKYCNNSKYMFEIMPTILCCKVFSKEFLRKNEIILPEGRIYEDIAVLFKWLPFVRYIIPVNHSLYLYRQHEQSTTSRRELNKLIQIIDAIEGQYLFLKDNKMLEKYRQRFESFAITHIVTEFVPYMVMQKDGIEYAEKSMDYMHSRFKGYERNPYISGYSFRNRGYLTLCNMRFWNILKCIIKIKATAKRIVVKAGLVSVYNRYRIKAAGKNVR